MDWHKRTILAFTLSPFSPTEKMAKDPSEVIRLAVRGMLPKNKLMNDRMLRLRVFAGESHDHEAQTPKKVEVK
jgi:large subunit ribosomal protein L13